jgi:hypothetical protein
VAEFVDGVIARAGTKAAPADTAGGPPIALAQDMKDDHPPARSWGPIQFVHPEFEHVNGCAYFDYQRERVYVRSSEAIRRSVQQSKASRNRKLRCNKHFVLTSTTCPCCKESVVSGVPREKATCRVPPARRKEAIEGWRGTRREMELRGGLRPGG